MCVEKPSINSNEQHIAGYTEDVKKEGKIQLNTATNREIDETYKIYTWFHNPLNCISKWSKALESGHTATASSKENDRLNFSLFL